MVLLDGRDERLHPHGRRADEKILDLIDAAPTDVVACEIPYQPREGLALLSHPFNGDVVMQPSGKVHQVTHSQVVLARFICHGRPRAVSLTGQALLVVLSGVFLSCANELVKVSPADPIPSSCA
jgi:hypothetical protein